MFGVKKMNSHVKNYVYLLNGTLCANGRTFLLYSRKLSNRKCFNCSRTIKTIYRCC
ncbi:hypothetical protein BCR36DRAFT_109022 [Piromyces finnis]|uniref:Uncharacterized protein n=1 Tax=Piromyces finnis TaxID=1754191 RepID=A0A1Y1V2R4_9FUNG|nr:hypothetical protein BCR36DRAFT_109022 [Piromyces finnis]|eukprot:ORX45821.1 hypothetical protein BCR36DRAFT_109022 [Piromyces finnis]